MNNQKFVIIQFAKYIFILNSFFIGSICIASNIHSENLNLLKVLDLKCEYAKNPIGLDIQSPQFSWRIESANRGTLQSAYQVMVTDSPTDSSPESNIWDSGKINSSRSAGIIYDGPQLISRKRYYWKVKIWDTYNQEATSSEPAYFEMALMNQEDWEAEWIGRASSWTGRPLYYRCHFQVEKPVQQARAYISGLGYYELHINGGKVGGHVLDPGVTNYDKRVLYTTYDITGLLKKDNMIGVIVGAGWYGIPKLRMQTEIIFTDGTKQIVKTDRSRTPFLNNWKVSFGPIVSSSLYDGELYDAREERPGWDVVGSINSNAPIIRFITPPGGQMSSQKLEPIEVVDTILPVSITEPIVGTYVIDAGQNLAGWAAIKVEGNRGTEVSLKFAEMLYDNGTVNQENLRKALAEDRYILKGDSGNYEFWEPKFTYHGFRYIQLEGFPYRPKANDILIKVVRSAVDRAGDFTCSNDLLNRIHKMVVSTEASNLHSIPTDCPQRNERQGWLNDITVRIGQALYNFNLSRFYPKFIEDINDTQKPDGSIYDTAPRRGGYNPADPVDVSYLLLALKCYEFYGNKMIIHRNYENLKAWVDYLYSRTEEGILNYSRFGDWSPPKEFCVSPTSPISKNTPGVFMSTGYFYYSCILISQMAQIIGNEKDAIYYEVLAGRTAKAFNEKFWNGQTGGYGSNNQACNSFALFLGLVEEGRISQVVDNLVKDVKAHDYHLTTGNLCTKYLLEMLTEYGHPEVAYRIATQETYPGWGYMLAMGATTLCERWEYNTGSGMNSHNHPMMGSVDSWMYKYLTGIIPDSEKPGFERFSIRPYIIEGLSSAKGEYNSIKGLIKSSWEKANGKISINATIPANSTAIVYIPTKNYKNITEGNQPVDKVIGIRFLRAENNYAIYQVGSGTYYFESEWE